MTRSRCRSPNLSLRQLRILGGAQVRNVGLCSASELSIVRGNRPESIGHPASESRDMRNSRMPSWSFHDNVFCGYQMRNIRRSDSRGLFASRPPGSKRARSVSATATRERWSPDQASPSSAHSTPVWGAVPKTASPSCLNNSRMGPSSPSPSQLHQETASEPLLQVVAGEGSEMPTVASLRQRVLVSRGQFALTSRPASSWKCESPDQALPSQPGSRRALLPIVSSGEDD